LGVRHEVRVEGGPREIVGVDTEICALFSSRRTQVKGQLAEMVTAYTEAHGTEPSQWTRARMSDWATLQTRQRKEGSETTAEALARWAVETRNRVGSSLAEVWAKATEARLFHDADLDAVPEPNDEEVLADAIEAVETTHSTWTRYDLARAVTLALPVRAESTPEDLLARVDGMVGAAIGDRAAELGVVSLAVPGAFEVPERLRRVGDGASVYVQHGAERYATAGGLLAERRVLAAAGRTDGPAVSGRRVGRVLRQADLGLDQELAVRGLLGSGRLAEAVLGPAGVGKTTTMAVLARAWSSSGRSVMGLAPSETAARVLGQAAGIHALNTAKLCWEHAHASPEERADPAWQTAFGIAPGALVILDEAAMASRMVLDEVTRLTTAAGAKLVLMGDHHQLEAPEASGLFRHLVETLGAVELSQVRRFAAAWEAAASLRLRSGDVTVLEEYELRSRIVGGSVEEMEAAVLEAALADEARGLATFVLADTNEAAAGLSGRFRDALVEVGRVDDNLTLTLSDGNRAGAGDRIVTRLNDRTVATTAGSWVANRDRWAVIGVHADGITAARLDSAGRPIPERVELAASYLATSAELAYAGTVHSSQGATADVTHVLISPTTSRAGLYVGLTRGALANHAYVVCTRAEGADQDGPTQDPLAVLAGILEREENPLARSALATAEAEARRAVSLASLFPIWSDLLAEAGRDRWMAVLSQRYDPSLARAMVDADAWGTLAARLANIEAAGLDAGAALVDAAGLRGLEDADDIAAVMHWRLRGAERSAQLLGSASFAELCPSYGSDLDATLAQVAAAMDARVVGLAEKVERDQPAWAAGLGPRPADDAVAWLARAGTIAGYREAFAWDDLTEALGPRPPVTRADARAWWERAALALGHAEAPTLAAMPTEHLEAMIQAGQAQPAPPSVATELADLYAQLRATQTAEGVALLTGNASRAAGQARWAEELADQITTLEAAHAQRVAWSAEAGRRAAQVGAARAELSARQEARAQAPRGSWSEVRLHRAIADARLGVDSMTRVANDQEEIASGLSDEIEAARTNLERLVRLRPAVRAAAQRVRAEAGLARRLDALDAELAVSRMDRSGLRGRARAAALSEREALAQGHPELTDPASRPGRWAALAEDADARHDQAVGKAERQVHKLEAERQEYLDLARQCREELGTRQSHLEALLSRVGSPVPAHPGPDEAPTPAGPRMDEHLMAAHLNPQVRPPQVEP